MVRGTGRTAYSGLRGLYIQVVNCAVTEQLCARAVKNICTMPASMQNLDKHVLYSLKITFSIIVPPDFIVVPSSLNNLPPMAKTHSIKR